jgi:ABC-type branched-subunit amino acid transport system substrate-binding protein
MEADFANEKAAVIYEKGNVYFKQKEYVNAIIEFEKIIDKYQNSDAFAPSLYLTAFSYFKLNRFERAVSYGEKFVEEFPNSPFYLNGVSLLGESYFKLGKDYRAVYYLIKYYVSSEDTVGREASFDRILKILPELSTKQLEKLHRIFMADPIDEHILYVLAQIEAREGKKEEAERDFNLLLRRFPKTKYTYEVEEYKRFIGVGKTTQRAGILLPLTGKYSEIGEGLMEIITTFQKDKNLPFSIHYVDTKSDPISATIAAGKLIDDIHVDFIISAVSSSEAFGICGLAYAKDVPVILPMTSETRFEQIPLIFTTALSVEKQAKVIAKYSMYDLGINKFAILYPGKEKYKAIADAFAKEVLKNNREVVALVNFDPDSITLRWELTAIKTKEPEAIFLPMETDMIINTAPQVAYYGLEGIQLLGIETFHDEKLPRFGERYVEKSVFAAPAAIDTTTQKEFNKRFKNGTDFEAKLFRILWQLRNLGEYNRAILPNLLSKILKGKEIINIFTIQNGEFEKLIQIFEKKDEG